MDIDINIFTNDLIDINIFKIVQNGLFDIDIFKIVLIDIDINIFQNGLIDIDINIDILKMTLSILIPILIFSKSVDISIIDISYRYSEHP